MLATEPSGVQVLAFEEETRRLEAAVQAHLDSVGRRETLNPFDREDSVGSLGSAHAATEIRSGAERVRAVLSEEREG